MKECFTCGAVVPSGVYSFEQCGKCIDNGLVKLTFKGFDFAECSLVIGGNKITDKLLIDYVKSQGVKKRNISVFHDNDRDCYGVMSLGMTPEPLGNIVIKR